MVWLCSSRLHLPVSRLLGSSLLPSSSLHPFSPSTPTRPLIRSQSNIIHHYQPPQRRRFSFASCGHESCLTPQLLRMFRGLELLTPSLATRSSSPRRPGKPRICRRLRGAGGGSFPHFPGARQLHCTAHSACCTYQIYLHCTCVPT